MFHPAQMSKLNVNGISLEGEKEYRVANFSLAGISNMVNNN